MRNIQFIAEIGMNHNGNHDLIYELIRQAKRSGADYAKIQLGWRCGDGEINQLSLDDVERIRDWCHLFDIKFLSSIISEEALDIAVKLDLHEIKIASRTILENYALYKKICSSGKRVFASLGMWDGQKALIRGPNIKYLYCVSKYPTFFPDLCDFPENFGDDYHGYSDHLIGEAGCVLAACRGANLIEKHFTLDKSDTTIRDHALSATPDEFRNMVNLCQEIRMLTDAIK